MCGLTQDRSLLGPDAGHKASTSVPAVSSLLKTYAVTVEDDAVNRNRTDARRRTRAKPFDPVWLRADFTRLIDSLSLSPSEEHFLRSRWLEYLIWMESAAQRTRFRYYTLRCIIAVGAVIVPALVSLNVVGAAKAAILWVTFAVSLVAGISTALDGFFHLGDRWRHYRVRVEELKAEGWDYFELAGQYADAHDHNEAFPAFEANVQGLLAQEVKEFIAEIARAPESDQTQKPGQ
jgi:hypothetical protein